MTKHTKRVLLASGLAPWVVVVVAAAWSLYYSTPQQASPGRPKEWEFVFCFTIYGVPTAYLSLVFGVPVYYLLRHYGLATYWTMSVAGLVLSLPAVLFFGLGGWGTLHMLIFLPPFGLAVALFFLWLVKPRLKKDAEPSTGGNAAPPRASA